MPAPAPSESWLPSGDGLAGAHVRCRLGVTSTLFSRPPAALDMCRNIKTLANFEPPATDVEIRASALQFVRKLSGTTHPSRANEAAFDRAVEQVTAAAQRLIASYETAAPPRNREDEIRKARERSRQRFAKAPTPTG